jgi:hypothetical protein
MIAREELYRLVWSQPMTKVAVALDVSGSYLARVCVALRVPRPERGYWAKLQAGRAPAVPPLPPARSGDLQEWTKDASLPWPSTRRVEAPAQEPRKRQRRLVSETDELIREADVPSVIQFMCKHVPDFRQGKAPKAYPERSAPMLDRGAR